MAKSNQINQTALGDVAARQLAIATRTVPQMVTISPRWLTKLLNWVPVESGVYRLNKVKDASSIEVDCSARDERILPQTFVDYIENPREYNLAAVQTIDPGNMLRDPRRIKRSNTILSARLCRRHSV